MIYDLIIIGAGAAGLFAGASLPRPVNGLILEKKGAPGRKLLMSGSGQCNLTHGGNIKDFISHYGKNGPQIRSVLYRFNNLSVIDFFERKGIALFEREDGKIFPKSLKSSEVLNVLVESCVQNGLQFRPTSVADQYTYTDGIHTVRCGDDSYSAKKLIVATGGCSYPATGSDGSFFSVLKEMGISLVPTAPALVPVFVDRYPYGKLSGISFQNAEITASTARNQDALLLTHNCFSGPAILNLSRFARPGDLITINYYPAKSEDVILKELSSSLPGNNKQILTVLYEYFPEVPKRFLEAICGRVGVDGAEKASRLPRPLLKALVRLIVRDEHQIQRLGGYESAMVTAGGVSLSEISTKTMESKKFPGLFFVGEVLDVDGDTGGYNLQFAFSSGFLAAQNCLAEKIGTEIS